MEKEKEKERKIIYTVLVDGEIVDVTTDVWEASRDVEHAVSMHIGDKKEFNVRILVEAWPVLI